MNMSDAPDPILTLLRPENIKNNEFSRRRKQQRRPSDFAWGCPRQGTPMQNRRRRRSENMRKGVPKARGAILEEGGSSRKAVSSACAGAQHEPSHGQDDGS